MNGKWSAVSLSFLLVIAFLGTVLRAMVFIGLPFDYGHLLHAHSHTAFQGWVYTAMMLFMVNLFLAREQIQAGRYALQFKTTVAVIIGVLVSFSIQGYGLYSIIISTLFQLLNYWFIVRFFKDVRHLPISVSLRWVKTGLWLGLLSTLAPFAIGALSAKGLGGTEAYQSAIYFFLHFQYNGWFQFVTLGLFFKWLEKDGVAFDPKRARQFYGLFTVAVVPAYLLSLLGMSFSQWVWVPAAMAALLQILALWAFYQLLGGEVKTWFSSKSKWLQGFLFIAAFSFFFKYILQFLSVIPPIQAVAFSSRNLIVGYLHLCLLGVISCFFIAMLMEMKWLKLSLSAKIGSSLFLIGFIVTEVLLGSTGMGWGTALLPLLLFSAAMVVGIGCLLVGRGRKSVR